MPRGTDVTNMKRTYRTAVETELPVKLNLELTRESDLRYGENPNQEAAMFRLKASDLAELTDIRLAKRGKSGLSATNFMDVTRALDILKFFDVPAVAVMKHLVPSGFAKQHNQNPLDNIYKLARDADARSAFGSIVVSNHPIDKATAEEIMSTYVEGVAAPEFEDGAIEIFERKKDLRTILFSHLRRLPRFTGDDTKGLYDIKALPTGRVLVQKPYLTSIRGPEDLITDPMVIKDGEKHIVERDPTNSELDDLLTSWYVNIGVRSNGIVLVKDGVTLAVGTGQQERIGAVEQSIVKSYQKAMDRAGISYSFVNGATRATGNPKFQNPLKGAVMSSDAFFPFIDSVGTAAAHGITAVIQPGGSVRDYDVIDAVNQNDMAMAFTLERCFGHF